MMDYIIFASTVSRDIVSVWPLQEDDRQIGLSPRNRAAIAMPLISGMVRSVTTTSKPSGFSMNAISDAH
jgi:hypothetical protein